jgi:DNA-binding response OmpR family regulator
MARLLLVDDEPDILAMLRDGLVRVGHSVDVAASADEATRLAEDNTYDVAIIDYVLPGKRGLDLLQELRQRNPFLRAIIISGQIDHETLSASALERELQERIAADRYIAKPARLEHLTAAIDELLRAGREGDWKEMAKDAVTTHDVKPSQVKKMDSLMRRTRKKRK